MLKKEELKQNMETWLGRAALAYSRHDMEISQQFLLKSWRYQKELAQMEDSAIPEQPKDSETFFRTWSSSEIHEAAQKAVPDGLKLLPVSETREPFQRAPESALVDLDEAFKSAINEIIDFYESIGFDRFDNPWRPNHYPQEPAEILRKIHGRMPNFQHPCVDNWILTEFFNEDVWSGDIECDVCDGNSIYRTTLYGWADVSHGAFAAKDIVELWDSDTGPITVRFELGRVWHDLHPKYLNDYLDLSIIEPINKLIAASGRSFEVGGWDQQVVVMCISDQQKQAMIAKRNFPFTERIPQLIKVFQRTPLFLD